VVLISSGRPWSCLKMAVVVSGERWCLKMVAVVSGERSYQT
jgi:hypothetical protein